MPSVWIRVKHMERSTVQYFVDKFKAVNPDLFIFGEVAQKRHELHNVEEINPHWYTWRGTVGSSEAFRHGGHRFLRPGFHAQSH